jgi:hypothetical protein
MYWLETKIRNDVGNCKKALHLQELLIHFDFKHAPFLIENLENAKETAREIIAMFEACGIKGFISVVAHSHPFCPDCDDDEYCDDYEYLSNFCSRCGKKTVKGEDIEIK